MQRGGRVASVVGCEGPVPMVAYVLNVEVLMVNLHFPTLKSLHHQSLQDVLLVDGIDVDA